MLTTTKYVHFFFVFIFYSFSTNAQSRITNIDSVLKVLPTIKTDTAKARLLIKIGQFYSYNSLDKSLQYFSAAYNLSPVNKQDEINIKLKSSAFLASSYLSKGNIMEYKKWLDKCLFYLPKANEPYALDVGYNNLSTYYINAGKYDTGIFYAQKIITLWDSLNNKQRNYNPYYAIAYAYFIMKMPDKCLETVKRIQLLIDESDVNKSMRLTEVYILLTQLYSSVIKKYDSAYYYSNLGLAIAEKENNIESTIDLLNFKCDALVGMNKKASIKKIASKSYALAIENNYNSGVPSAAKNLAYYFAFANKNDSAEHYATIADKSLKEITNDVANMIDNYQMWSDIYKEIGNFKMAYVYKDSQYILLNNETQKELKNIAIEKDTKFETARKEAQIITLALEKKQGKILQLIFLIGLVLALLTAAFAYRSYRSKRKVALVLENSNKEKEVFLKEIHHRVKNNLQIISSLLYMQFKDAKDDKMLAQLKQAQERIKSMALVHNKLYEKQDVVHVYLKEYIQDLATGILSGNTPVGKEIQLHVEENKKIHLSLDTTISLGLILNEIITNSCKYAFENKELCNIYVSVTQENNQFKLIVKDDGIGLPSNYEQKYSLGIRLVKNLSRQLNGSVNFSNNNGTVVLIEFSEV